MKKSPLFLLLSLSIVCWQAKAMERVKEDPLEKEAEKQHEEKEIEEAIEVRDQAIANPKLKNEPEVVNTESFTSISSSQDTSSLLPTPLPSQGEEVNTKVRQVFQEDHRYASDTAFFNQQAAVPTEQEKLAFKSFPSLQEITLQCIAGHHQQGANIDTSDKRVPEQILKGADNHLNLLSARIKKLQVQDPQDPKEKKLIEFLIYYRDNFQEVYETANDDEDPKPSLILEHFGTSIRTIKKKEASLPLEFYHENEHFCHEKVVAWEKEALKQLLAEPPEIALAIDSLKIATCYRKAVISFKKANEYRIEERAELEGNNQAAADRLRLSALDIAESCDVLIKQAEALEKALEAKGGYFTEIYSEAAGEFQEAYKQYRRAAQEILTGNRVGRTQQISIGHKRENSGDALIKRAEALKRALQTKAKKVGKYPDIAQLDFEAANVFNETSKYFRDSAQATLDGNERESNRLYRVALTGQELGDTLIQQAEALEKAVKAGDTEIANIYFEVENVFRSLNKASRKLAQAILEENETEKNKQQLIINQQSTSIDTLMQQAEALEKNQDLLEQETEGDKKIEK